MSNNLIQIKRSTNTANPGTVLSSGELAYSYSSNSLFIGSPNGPGVGAPAILIGGSNYRFLDSAIQGTLVANSAIITDANSFVSNLYSKGLLISSSGIGSSNSSVAFITSISPQGTVSQLGNSFTGSNNELVTSWAIKNYVDQQISLSGSFSPTTPYVWTSVQSHTANVDLTDNDPTSNFPIYNTLNIGFSNNTYRATLSANQSTILIANTVANTILNLSTLTFTNSQGFSISANLNNLSFRTGNATFFGTLSYTSFSLSEPGASATITPNLLTVPQITVGSQFSVTSTLANFGAIQNVFASSANATFRNVNISGNLTVSGTTTVVDTGSLSVKDNIINIATNNNVTDTVDVGIVGQSASTYYGFARIAQSNSFQLFATSTAPTDNISNPSTMPLRAFLQPYGTGGAFIVNSSAISITANNTVSVNFVANSIVLGTPLTLAGGGTGFTSYTAGDIIYAVNQSTLAKLAIGSNGQVLQVKNNIPSYGKLDGGTY